MSGSLNGQACLQELTVGDMDNDGFTLVKNQRRNKWRQKNNSSQTIIIDPFFASRFKTDEILSRLANSTRDKPTHTYIIKRGMCLGHLISLYDQGDSWLKECMDCNDNLHEYHCCCTDGEIMSASLPIRTDDFALPINYFLHLTNQPKIDFHLQ